MISNAFKLLLTVSSLLLISPASAFLTNSGSLLQKDSNTILMMSSDTGDKNFANEVVNRRSLIASSLLLAGVTRRVNAEETGDKSKMFSPEFVQSYDDFIKSDKGYQYKDVKVGSDTESITIEDGDRVVYDWSGYTIGYFGRPFQAKGGPTGGAFDKDLDFSRTIIGSHTVCLGVEDAFRTMKPGGIRQVVVPFGPLSYPPTDLEHNQVGPKPTTFSGQRALNFVLENPRVDRTLLFNLKLIRVDKADGKGGFKRG